MRVKNDSRFLFGSNVTSRVGRKLEMVAVVRATFTLEEKVCARPYTERKNPNPQGMLSGDVFAPGDVEGEGEVLYADDLAQFKPKADLLFQGTAYAPNGEPTPTLGVRMAVGAWSKLFRVVGDRTWKSTSQASGATDPKPFKAMPLEWSRAWGGPANPVGRSLESPLVPNLERSDEPVLDRSAVRGPVSFAPVNPRWQPRAAKAGQTFDAAYQRDRAPFHPTDMDWTYFNAAPEDQQVPYLRGDEEVVLQNLHPTIAVFRTKLPGIRIRVFGKRVDPDGPKTPEAYEQAEVFEFSMVLDTLLVDNASDKVVLTWRGLAPCAREDLRDVPFVLVAEEPLSSAPKPASEYKKQLDVFAKDPTEQGAWLTPEMEALRAAGRSGAGAVSADGVTAVDQVLKRRGGPFAEPHRAGVKEFLQRAVLGTSGRTDLNASLAGAAAANASHSTSNRPAAPVSGGGGAGGMPTVRLRESVQQIEDNARAAQRHVADKANKRPRALSQVTNLAKDERLRAIDPSLAEPKRKKPPKPGPGASCKGGDYREMNFDGQDLSGVDFTDALLEKASFRGAKLQGAKLDRAMAMEADFTDADLSRASLSKANFTRAKLPGANLEGATLDMAALEESDLTRARLVDVKAVEVLMREAKLDDANLLRASFTRSILQKCSVTRADMSHVTLDDCLCVDWSAHNVKLENAVAVKTCFNNADFKDGNLRRISAEGCAFFNARLGGLDLRGANLQRSFFNDADLSAAKLSGANLKTARFTDANLRHADLRGADVFEADFSRAKLDHANFEDANAYGAGFWDAGGQKSNFSGANLTRAMPEPK